MQRYENQTVIVTGGGGGIGSATCRRLAAEGAKVAVFDMNLDAADKVAQEIRAAGGQAQAKIHAYYEAVLGDFSVTDMTHTLHYLIRMLESMDRVDSQQLGGSDADPEDRIPDL